MTRSLSSPPSSEELALSATELLETAEHLYSSGDNRALRAAVLEAVSALESFVHTAVSPRLPDKVGQQLATWLEAKTRTDFDARLSLLYPLATGLPIDKSSGLWTRYKSARRARNDVAHLGARITKPKARKIIDTVYELINYLGALPTPDIARTDEDRDRLLGRFLQAWAKLERSLYQAGVSSSRHVLRESGAHYSVDRPPIPISSGDKSDIRSLRQLRNRVVHGDETAWRDIRQGTVDKVNRIATSIETAATPKKKARRKRDAAA